MYSQMKKVTLQKIDAENVRKKIFIGDDSMALVKHDYPILEYDTASNVIVKTCSDIFYTIGQKKCPMPSAKIRNYSHSHNLVSQ